MHGSEQCLLPLRVPVVALLCLYVLRPQEPAGGPGGVPSLALRTEQWWALPQAGAAVTRPSGLTGPRSRGCGARTPHSARSSQPRGPHSVSLSSSVVPNKLLPAAAGGKRVAGTWQRACSFMPAFTRRAPQAPSSWCWGRWVDAVHSGAPGTIRQDSGRRWASQGWVGCPGSDAGGCSGPSSSSGGSSVRPEEGAGKSIGRGEQHVLRNSGFQAREPQHPRSWSVSPAPRACRYRSCLSPELFSGAASPRRPDHTPGFPGSRMS